MTLTTDSEKAIQSYIKNTSHCRLNRVQPTEIAGKRIDLEVCLLPTSMLHFNVRNGRFAAEYNEIKKKIGRDLDPRDQDDCLKIRKMLLNQNKAATRLLKADLRRVGQKNPGIITSDGAVINGNRRLAIIQLLHEETGEEKWAYMEVSILPRGTSEKDIWRIEAGLQFSREERLDYGPINRLLKLREGVKSGLTPRQIAATLYGGFKPEEIEEDLDRLKLIESYLDYIGKSDQYNAAEGLNEHFIDLRNIIATEQSKGTDPLDLMTIIKIAFELIRNKTSHMEIREIRKIMKVKEAKTNLIEETKKSPKTSHVFRSRPKDVKSTKLAETEKNKLPPPNKDAPAVQVFRESVELAKATLESNKPAKLLKRALTNLKSINLNCLKKNTRNAKELVAEIDEKMTEIKNILSE